MMNFMARHRQGLGKIRQVVEQQQERFGLGIASFENKHVLVDTICRVELSIVDGPVQIVV
jgi:hypothetical protein